MHPSAGIGPRTRNLALRHQAGKHHAHKRGAGEDPGLRRCQTFATGKYLLTPREEQVIALVSEGLSNHDIARELRLSEHTVKKYVSRIFDKLGISTRVELVLYAVNHGDTRPAEWVAGGE